MRGKCSRGGPRLRLRCLSNLLVPDILAPVHQVDSPIQLFPDHQPLLGRRAHRLGKYLQEAVVGADHPVVTHRALFFRTEDRVEVEIRGQGAVIIHRDVRPPGWVQNPHTVSGRGPQPSA